jgi:hypothetical protein
MITFTLLALLLYPDPTPGRYEVLKLGEGLTKEECVIAQNRTHVQLPQTLSVAKLVATACQKETNA